jgi:hypothetical protein
MKTLVGLYRRNKLQKFRHQIRENLPGAEVILKDEILVSKAFSQRHDQRAERIEIFSELYTEIAELLADKKRPERSVFLLNCLAQLTVAPKKAFYRLAGKGALAAEDLTKIFHLLRKRDCFDNRLLTAQFYKIFHFRLSKRYGISEAEGFAFAKDFARL